MSEKRNVTSMRKAFELQRSLSFNQRSIVLDRKTGQGVAVDNDRHALRWQAMELNIYILELWILGEPLDIDYVIDMMERQVTEPCNG